MLEVEHLTLDGPMLIRPRVFADDRGHFLESFNEKAFSEATGVAMRFVQDNTSLSHKNVLRGLHFQVEPHAQAKLVRVVHGAVMDVCVDIRPESSRFGAHLCVELSEADHALLFVPAGFAHGFLAREPGSVFQYKCSKYYHPAAERTLRWNDPALGIDWGIDRPIVSEKDQAGATFAELFGRTP
ncbi:MAG: dTDP-4-dehydrorhamnose 3,5-epimerase [Flavobacteriales bacterium]|nr:dTDP-4-dehydrorhamnose 3,5-epimerase [Flavobacteriales bacterium]MCB9194467.1 dTDP-4-dehydrorhamnose 3,5-epimerase [Flavobacteriales bacterium]